MKHRLFLYSGLLLTLLSMGGCGGGGGGGGGSPPPSVASYSIGGKVTGLAGTGLVLQNNGAGNLSLSANGSFIFATAVNDGGSYNVTVLTQPSVPSQTCAVTGGTGSVSGANVTNVAVTCQLFSPRFAYVANQTSNTVSIYTVNATTGQLRPNGYVTAG
ncbi:MAG TPA: hypothetical protein VK138_11435, partial [Acidiferrobacterales bacterium]|nr:hypothetical protein [Acidiferrobacterales bacterium]